MNNSPKNETKLSDTQVSHLNLRNYITEIKKAMKNLKGSLEITHAFLMQKP